MKQKGNSIPQTRILVTGGSGFLGSNLVAVLRNKHDVAYTFRGEKMAFRGAQGIFLDLHSSDGIERVVEQMRPHVIIHCAALTDVDYCELHPDEVKKINVEATRLLLHGGNRLDAHFIFVSTEAVYDGLKGNFREEDSPNPANQYAQTKLNAEKVIQKEGERWFIARTGFEGWRLNEKRGKPSFFEWLISKFENQKPFNVFEDRLFTPLSIYNFISILDEVIDRRIEGLFNVEGREAMSYLDFAEETARVFGYDSTLIRPIPMDSFSASAFRPKNTSLNIDRILKRLKTPVLAGVREMLQEFKQIRDSGRLEHLRKELSEIVPQRMVT